MRHLLSHKHRLVILKPKIEGLPDNHSSKPECLFELSRLLDLVGNQAESKRLLTCVLKLERERGNDHQVARTLKHLAEASYYVNPPGQGIQLVKEALGIGERLGDRVIQAQCLVVLAWLLDRNNRVDAAEEAAFRTIDLFPEKGEEYRVCQSHRILGEIYRHKGEKEKAIHHFEVALGIASPFDWHMEPFWIHYRLARLFYCEGRFDEAQTHVAHPKSYTVNSALNLGYAMEVQACVWYRQQKLEEARSEFLRAVDVYEKFGVAEGVKDCRRYLQDIENELDTEVASDRSNFDCELL